MSKPVASWMEDDILWLPSGESDSFERKGTSLLDLTISGVKEDKVLDELAKQLSAFANTRGGQIIYGLTNAGAVDTGGVSRVVKGRQSTKEWLEDVIPILTDSKIAGFNVYEIQPKTTGSSSIALDKSLYVIDVPDSERAPHQSTRDLRYYVRLGSKSQPAPHSLIEDIRNRVRHPKLDVFAIEIAQATSQQSRLAGLASEFVLTFVVQLGLQNFSRVRAANACVQVSSNIWLATGHLNEPEYVARLAYGGEGFFLELTNPIYPGMQVGFSFLVQLNAVVQVLPTAQALTVGGKNLQDAPLVLTIFADSAPFLKREFVWTDIDPRGQLGKLIQGEVGRIKNEGRPPFFNPGA